MAAVQETVDRVRSIDVDAYKYGFVTDIETDKAPPGLNEDTSASSRPRRASRNGCSTGGSTRIGAG